jgi:hypothetical protein
VVNIFNDLHSHRLAMSYVQVVSHPSHKVIFEGSFDKLVQKVRCKKFVNVGSWKSMSERLMKCVSGLLANKEGNEQQYCARSQTHPIGFLD